MNRNALAKLLHGICLAILCFVLPAFQPAALSAATIQRAEYRKDGGVAQAIDFVSSDTRSQYWEGDYQAEVPTAGLSVGPHWLEVRMQGDNSVWSAWQGKWIHVTGETHLVAAEWFIDTDPGPGNGATITLPADGAWDEPVEDFIVGNMSSSDLPPGNHILYARCRDSNGDWGITNETMFYVAAPLFVAAAEWTTDSLCEPGWGAPMAAADGAFDGAEEDLVTAIHTSQVGSVLTTYTLYVRVQDSLGRWSTRGGLVWDEGTEQWEFDPDLGWTKEARVAILFVELTIAQLCDYLQGKTGLTNSQLQVADMNKDGVIDIADVILLIALEKVGTFPPLYRTLPNKSEGFLVKP